MDGKIWAWLGLANLSKFCEIRLCIVELCTVILWRPQSYSSSKTPIVIYMELDGELHKELDRDR